MKKWMIAATAALAIVASTPANAWMGGGGYGGWRGGGYGYGRGGWGGGYGYGGWGGGYGGEMAIAGVAGMAVGALAGAALSQPQYAPPPPPPPQAYPQGPGMVSPAPPVVQGGMGGMSAGGPGGALCPVYIASRYGRLLRTGGYQPCN